ncbi:MAG: flgB [Phycisphaerales bacterium]|nr:flgB [Phycisphaerales bacterium]
MIDRLFNDANVPLLEKMVRFTQARERVLANDIVNLSTPNYTPQDLSQDKFQEILRHQVDTGTTGSAGTNGETDEALKATDANENILFHDRNNRSVEQLMSDHANNALMHNMMIELMRKQFAQIQEALKEHVS